MLKYLHHAEGWPSGLRRRFAKSLEPKVPRRFESCPLRHIGVTLFCSWNAGVRGSNPLTPTKKEKNGRPS